MEPCRGGFQNKACARGVGVPVRGGGGGGEGWSTCEGRGVGVHVKGGGTGALEIPSEDTALVRLRVRPGRERVE